MIFHNRNKNITYAVTRVKQFNFLGRLIDENLNWNAHIDQSCAKLSRAIGILYRLKYIEYQFWKINCFLPVKIFLYTMNPTGRLCIYYLLYYADQQEACRQHWPDRSLDDKLLHEDGEILNNVPITGEEAGLEEVQKGIVKEEPEPDVIYFDRDCSNDAGMYCANFEYIT